MHEFTLGCTSILSPFRWPTNPQRTLVCSDFLGALCACGVVREKMGDILVEGDRGATLFVAPELGDVLASSVVQVRSVKARGERVCVCVVVVVAMGGGGGILWGWFFRPLAS